MKPKILEHHVVIRMDDDKPVLCLEIAYSDTIGKHQWWFIKDLPEDFKDEHIPNYLKTFQKAIEETERKRRLRKKNKNSYSNSTEKCRKHLKAQNMIQRAWKKQ